MPTDWSGHVAREARKYWKARLAAEGSMPCLSCGMDVTVDDVWDVGHRVAIIDGGDLRDRSNQWVQHRNENRRDGQRIAARRKAEGAVTRVEPFFEAEATTLAPAPPRSLPEGSEPPSCAPAHLTFVPDVIDLTPFWVGCDALGITPKPHQIDLARLILAGVYRRVSVCWPRRCGKTMAIWACLIGLCLTRPGFVVAVTAQSGVKATDRFREIVERLTRVGSGGWTPRYAAGRQGISFDNGSAINIRPPKPDAFRGDEADVVWADESQEHDVPTTRDLLGAILPLFDTRPGAVLITSGTAGSAREAMLWEELERGRAGRDGAAISEYAANDEDDLADEATWWANHPGLASGMTTIEILRERYEDLDVLAFGREYGGVWPVTASAALIDPEQWAALEVDSAAPPRDGSVVVSWDATPDGSSAAVVLSWKTDYDADVVLVQPVRSGEGTTWVAREVDQLVRDLKARAVYDAIGVNTDVAAMLTRLRTPRVAALRSSDLKGAFASIIERVADDRILHTASTELEDAIEEAERRPFGESWLWKRTPNAAVLVAATHAAWVAGAQKKRARTRMRSTGAA